MRENFTFVMYYAYPSFYYAESELQTGKDPKAVRMLDGLARDKGNGYVIMYALKCKLLALHLTKGFSTRVRCVARHLLIVFRAGQKIIPFSLNFGYNFYLAF